MTRPASLVNGHQDDASEPELRPVKRLKTATTTSNTTTARDTSNMVRRHPLGVRPSGNALTSSTNLKFNCGLFSKLPDELIMQFLEMLQVPHLLKLGATCKALHAFTRSEELWRTLFVESSPASFSWQGTWRSTFLSQTVSQEPRVNCSNLFSDVLHRPFYCAHVPLDRYISDIPDENRTMRLSDLSSEDFTAHWYNKPFILTSPVKDWPIFQKWTIEYLLENYANVRFRAESVDWPLKSYINYMKDSHDESPLYLFDHGFVEKMNLNAEDMDYQPPACFGTDLFSILEDLRPDYRWLIIGPARSGSTFHKDPNATSAWNAVIRGSKYWIMFPSSASLPPPPGVYVSEDQSEVTSPLSIAEWLLGFHAQARTTPGCKEGICYEGEVLHVPSGWYHLVLNLEPSIAITQNFIPKARLGAVLQFLRDQKQSISGFNEEIADPYSLFVNKLRDFDSQLLEKGLEELEKLTIGSRSKWQKLKDGDDEGSGGFSFGFGDDQSDEEGLS